MRTAGEKKGFIMKSQTPRKRLPVNPSLEHLQKQAKRLAKQNPALKLAEAQHQIARDYGLQKLGGSSAARWK